MTLYRVLLVEDDELTSNLLRAFLEKEGFVVHCATNGQEMTALLDQCEFDLVLLDLNLPDEDGLSLARQLRSRSPVPLVVLTARQEQADRIAALEIGADDYLTKPFDPVELVLRARNMLDRSGEPGKKPMNVKQFGNWRIDLGAHIMTSAKGSPLKLTRSEFNLMAAMVGTPKRVLSRSQLLDAIARGSETPSDRTVDVTISRLRRKIETDPKNPEFIVTVPGVGYMFAADVS